MERFVYALSSADPTVQRVLLVGVPAGVYLFIAWVLDVSWLQLALRHPRWQALALWRMRLDEEDEAAAASRREQAILDALSERDRRDGALRDKPPPPI